MGVLIFRIVFYMSVLLWKLHVILVYENPYVNRLEKKNQPLKLVLIHSTYDH